MSKAPASFLAMLLLGNLAEEEKNGNAKDVKTRQTCRYQDGDVPPTTTSDDREGDGGWRDDNGKRKRERKERERSERERGKRRERQQS